MAGKAATPGSLRAPQPAGSRCAHSMPFGAELQTDGRVRFRLWAPAQTRVAVEIDGSAPLPMAGETGGWHSTTTDRARAGSKYRFVLADGKAIADPASRRQDGDVEAASVVVDPRTYEWRHTGWRGREWPSSVLYELHVGTFTPEGTFAAARAKLPYLAALGVTTLELMPIAAFPGARNWGYDGALWFAPASCYGRPDDLKALIDAAHGLGLAVLLDVVYNHFGPHGNYLALCAPRFFTERHKTPWGAAINYDGQHSANVREFAIQNALYWTREYRVDGLRLDAVHAIIDDSPKHLVLELAERVRAASPDRLINLVLENEDNRTAPLHRDGAGRAPDFDAQWNDDVHHVLHTAVTGEGSGYYAEYLEDSGKLGRALTEGFAFQGEHMAFRGSQRGEPSAHLPPTAFVAFLQNHDQVGNRAFGERIGMLASAERVRAASAVYLLLPQVPLLFMGEEWDAAQPFLFFADLPGELGAAVSEGRRAEFARFKEFSDPEQRKRIPDPQAESTFESSRLDWQESQQGQHAECLTRYRELLTVRRREIVPLVGRLSGAGRLAYAEHGGVVAQWTAGPVVLSLAANLSAQARSLPFNAGREIWREGAIAADGYFGPWAVRWTVGRAAAKDGEPAATDARPTPHEGEQQE
jgi:malto-oligosyltrehalose trehalohydrolase